MVVQCRQFVQNAWRRDLCANCFKSRDEHREQTAMAPTATRPPLSVDAVQGILKGSRQRRAGAPATVRFPSAGEESQVIGVGGLECFCSDDEEDSVSAQDDSIDAAELEPEDEEERALQRLTRSNTDFNTVSGKVELMQLPLGRPRAAADGRKHTPLVVCVTPFGGSRNDVDADPDVLTATSLSRIPVLKGRVNAVDQSTSSQKPDTETALPKAPVPLVSEKNTQKKSEDDCELKPDIIDTKNMNGVVRAELRNIEPVEEDDCVSKELTSVTAETSSVKDIAEVPEKASPRIDTEVTVMTSNVSSDVKIIDDKVNLNITTVTNDFDVESTLTKKEKVINSEQVKVSQDSKLIHSTEECPSKVKRDLYTTKTSDSSKNVLIGDKHSEKSDELPVKINGSLFKYSASTSIFSARAHDVGSTLLKCEWKGKSVDLTSSKEKKTTTETYKAFKPTDKIVQKTEELSGKPNVETYKSSIGRNLFAMRLRNSSRVVQESCQTEVSTENNLKDKTSTIEGKNDVEIEDGIAPLKLETSPNVVTCNIPEVEREQPDGRAEDPEEEPPAVAITTAAPRPSFLHGVKPKLPQKPNAILAQPLTRVQKQVEQSQTQILAEQQMQQPISPQEQLQQPTQMQHQQQRQPADETVEVTNMMAVACLSAVDTRSPHKRQAPRPPPSSSSSTSSNSSVSCSPTEPLASSPPELPVPEMEEVTRDSLSEEESLTPSSTAELSASIAEILPDAHITTPVTPADKKKGRFSLRKFLRLTSSHHHNKDGENKTNLVDTHMTTSHTDTEEIESHSKVRPLSRPRLEIVHPFSLDGAAVEVVRSPAPQPQPQSPHGHISMKPLSASADNLLSTDSEMLATDSSSSLDADSPNHSPKERPVRPPPPPRGQLGRGIDGSGSKPVRPPPPRSAELLQQQKFPVLIEPVNKSVPQDNLYANLAPVSGEVRLGLTPDKPQRTASMRDANVEIPKRKSASEDSGYESVELAEGKLVSQAQQVPNENFYEHLGRGRSSSPDHGKLKTSRKCSSPRRRSDGSIDDCGCAKTRPGYLRSSSFTYCAFESDSDTYCPYSFYSGEEAEDDDTDWLPSSGHNCRNSHLRLRKGRSVIHESLEDNYGAVTVANHEALAQVLEQVKHSLVVPVPVALRGLKSAPELRWSNFSVDERIRTLAGRRAFYPALWMGHPVTLSVSAAGRGGGDLPTSRAPMLTPLAQFNDLIPARFLLRPPSVDPEHLVRASISVLVRLQVDTVQSYGRRLRERERWDEEAASFALLQLVNGLKRLQAQGVEEAPLSLTNFVLCRSEDCQQADVHPQLCALRELGASTAEGAGGASPRGSLCRCALVGLRHLHPASVTTQRTTLLADLLTRGQAASLSQAKSVLELWIWGPADAALSGTRTEREQSLQRWLDLERATALHELALVRTRPHHHLTIFEESRLLFLVTTSAEILADASFLLDGSSTIASDA